MSQLSDRSVLQLCVAARFYLENKGKYILEAWGHEDLKDPKRRERESVRERPLALWLLFLYVFLFLRLGLPSVNWASQECCLFYLRSSRQASDLPLFYFSGLFPSLSFSHRHSGLLFPILTTKQRYKWTLEKGRIHHGAVSDGTPLFSLFLLFLDAIGSVPSKLKSLSCPSLPPVNGSTRVNGPWDL